MIKIKILFAMQLTESEKNFLKEKLPNDTILATSNEAEILEEIKNSDVLLGFRLPREIIEKGQNLKLVHAISAGVDKIDLATLKKLQIPLCNTRGAQAPPCAEYVLFMMLLWEKKFIHYQQLIRDRDRLDHYLKILSQFTDVPGELTGKTLGIIGFGELGREIARKAKAFDLKILAIKRRHTPELKEKYNLDFLGILEDLDKVLPSDYLVLTIPATKETKNFIREEHFRKMKPETVLINISRADNVDELALLKAIENNWIKGAILDVIKDPRDPNNPLLKKENIIYTPHIAGRTTNTRIRELEIIVQNIENLRKNDTLINIVNLDLEY